MELFILKNKGFMIKIDCNRNKYVASVLEDKVPQIERAVADCTENFDIDDIMLSARTNNVIIGVPCENKALLGGWKFKYDGEWNPYFTTDIYHKLRFKEEPPEEGTPIYFINATDANGDYSNGKYQRLIDNNAALTFVAPDCIIFYTSRMLDSAFCGFADYYVRHRTEYGHDYRRFWETKAILNLNKGLYIPCDPPLEMFEK